MPLSRTSSYRTVNSIPHLEQELVIQGNFIVPLHNPFTLNECKLKESVRNGETLSDDIITLGPGLEMRLDHVLHVNKCGIITHFEHSQTDASRRLLRQLEGTIDGPRESVTSSLSSATNDMSYIKLSEYEFCSPGFIDCHIHAPQYVFTGTATDKPLMGDGGWLQKYAFPAEKTVRKMNLSDTSSNCPSKIDDVYQRVVRRTVCCGTTTAMYFGTVHLEPTKVLCQVISDVGQRGIVGKVCMDCNDLDHEYCQSLDQNISETIQMIEYTQKLPNAKRGLLSPAITPRFIPSCSPTLLEELGRVAAQYKCHIQSHISESIDEISAVRDKCIGNENNTDAQIFDDHGLLTDKTIMAHGNWLTDEDVQLLKNRGSAIAHCPLSNYFFAGKLLQTRQLMEKNLKIGLGTDVAGGYSPSMMDAARNAVITSQMVSWVQRHQGNPCNPVNHIIDYRHAYYLATLGGAEALGLQNIVGTFHVNKEFDAIVFSAAPSITNNIDIFQADSKEDVFQKICNLGDDRNIVKVFVQGKEIKEKLLPV